MTAPHQTPARLSSSRGERATPAQPSPASGTLSDTDRDAFAASLDMPEQRGADMTSNIDLFTANGAAHSLADALISERVAGSEYLKRSYREDAEKYLRRAASALGYDLVRKSDEVAA